MSVPLNTIRDYIAGLTWIENGLLTNDVTHVIDFLDTTPDSRWFVSQTRKCVVLIQHWQERLRYTIRKFEIELVQSRDVLDQTVRKQLAHDRRQVKMRYVEAGIMADPNHRQLVDTIQQYELVLGTLEGLAAALDTALVVQEAVSTRRQEIEDSQTP